MHALKRLVRWSTAGVGLMMVLGLGGLQVLSAGPTQPLGWFTAGGGVSCEDDCLNAFGTGFLYQGDYYYFHDCNDLGDVIVCWYVWEFA